MQASRKGVRLEWEGLQKRNGQPTVRASSAA